MLERFYQVINAIRKSLIDLKSDTKSDEQLLTDIIAALQPIKAAVEQLCCGEANLFTAGVTMKFMLNELVEQNNDLSIALKNV
jgi:bifunctional N-acetylglucosamine-1-phosphate-uridyltransferase/glucosamine-1-phosphate-acetyltransferase GlmU-like protein